MKKLHWLLIMLFVVGCSSTPKVVDPLGRELPNPRYIVKSFGDTGMTAMFWFAKIETSKDLDGAVIETKKYLEWRKEHLFSMGDMVEINVEVFNPNKLKYQVFDRVRVERSRSASNAYKLAESDREIRTYKFKMPIEKGIRCYYVLDITDEKGEPLLSIGAFNYLVEY